MIAVLVGLLPGGIILVILEDLDNAGGVAGHKLSNLMRVPVDSVPFTLTPQLNQLYPRVILNRVGFLLCADAVDQLLVVLGQVHDVDLPHLVPESNNW